MKFPQLYANNACRTLGNTFICLWFCATQLQRSSPCYPRQRERVINKHAANNLCEWNVLSYFRPASGLLAISVCWIFYEVRNGYFYPKFAQYTQIKPPFLVNYVAVSMDRITNETKKDIYGNLSSVHLELRGLVKRSVEGTYELGYKPAPSRKRREFVVWLSVCKNLKNAVLSYLVIDQLIVYYQQMHLMLILINLKCLKQ
jgi:hypothetical protein